MSTVNDNVMKYPRRTTLTEIARISKVSPALVSQILSAKKGTIRYSPQTAERVRRIARSLHYRPTLAAKILHEGRTNMIGILLPGSIDVYLRYFLPKAIETGTRHGYELVVTVGDPSDPAYHERVVHLLNRDVDGLVLFPTLHLKDQEFYRELVEGHRPVVLVEHDIGAEPFDLVGMDDLDAGRRSIAHLKALNHERIGFFYELENSGPSAHQRRIDFEQAVDEAGLPVLPKYYFQTPWQGDPKVLARLIEALPDLTAMVIRGHDRTRWVYQELVNRGIKIPGDLSIVNVTAHKYEDARVRFDSYHTGLEEMARTSVELLLDHLQNPGRSPKRIYIPGTLIPGETCSIRKNS
jgi:DNA-binding LacI/PurR family transcriptional regulator